MCICKRKKLNGFTLVEMLIVIAIIAVLSTMILRGVGGALPKSRDARRMGDLKNVQSSLEVYYSKQNTYPEASDWNALQTKMREVLGTNFTLPKDPGGGTYCYEAKDETFTGYNRYVLGAKLEVTTSSESLTGDTCQGINCGQTNSDGYFYYCAGI